MTSAKKDIATKEFPHLSARWHRVRVRHRRLVPVEVQPGDGGTTAARAGTRSGTRAETTGGVRRIYRVRAR